MSKKTDHFETGEGKDSEKAGLENASEEVARKRILASTPTPHRGNSPQGRHEVRALIISQMSSSLSMNPEIFILNMINYKLFELFANKLLID